MVCSFVRISLGWTDASRAIDQRELASASNAVLDPEYLLLLRFELVVGEDALIPKLGEPFELAHVVGLGGGWGWNWLGGSNRRLVLGAAEVLPHA
jgi:hypothetical protein